MKWLAQMSVPAKSELPLTTQSGSRSIRKADFQRLIQVLNQRGVPNSCAQYLPISLLELTATAAPISVNAGSIRLAQCPSLPIQTAIASSAFLCPAAMFSPLSRDL